MKKAILLTLCSAFLLPLLADHQTIAEKKRSLTQSREANLSNHDQMLDTINGLIWEKKIILRALYNQARLLYDENPQHPQFKDLLQEIHTTRQELAKIEENWRETSWREESAEGLPSEEYALWHQPNSTLEQLVMEYGSQDYVYLIPPEVGQVPVHVQSGLPIPKESWEQCLQLILAQSGVGIRQLNPLLRELYFLRENPAAISHITHEMHSLDALEPGSNACFILHSSALDPRSDLHFLQKFAQTNTTTLQLVGHSVLIMGPVESIKELLKLYHAIHKQGAGEDYQILTLNKLDPKETEAILKRLFCHEDESALQIIPLDNSPSLFLSGHKQTIHKAKSVIENLESEIRDPKEKMVFWYTAKHTEVEELAKILGKVYGLLTDNALFSLESPSSEAAAPAAVERSSIINTPSIGPLSGNNSPNILEPHQSFVVDPKSGSLIMVIAREALPQIVELLKRLDVPKRMVQIEVLFFEKKVSNTSKFGLNLLRLGQTALNIHASSFGWSGILEFMLSRKQGTGIPSFDMAYSFLLGQEDVQINASPSITTLNQTPVTFAIVDEVSVQDTVENSDGKGKRKTTFARKEYGITLQITPTIHLGENQNDPLGFITLDTNITFDSTKSKSDHLTDVTRRHIKNHVRVKDGETIILGGLRQKSSGDTKESIPFLGEIPGIGKLFSMTGMTDSSTEMFIFITPKILNDPLEDNERLKLELCKRRPGDVPTFLQALLVAREKEQKKLFQHSLTALFGRPDPLSSYSEDLKEYDGR